MIICRKKEKDLDPRSFWQWHARSLIIPAIVLNEEGDDSDKWSEDIGITSGPLLTLPSDVVTQLGSEWPHQMAQGGYNQVEERLEQFLPLKEELFLDEEKISTVTAVSPWSVIRA